MRNVFVATALACMSIAQAYATEQQIIRISTDQTDLVLQVGENGRLYQSYFGEKLLHESDLKNLPCKSGKTKRATRQKRNVTFSAKTKCDLK